MTTCIFGEDAFLVMRRADAIKDALRKTWKDETDVLVLTKPTSFDTFQQEARTQGLFSKKKIIILRDVLESIKPEAIPAWEQCLGGLSRDVYILFIDILPIKDARAHPLLQSLETKGLGEVIPVPVLSSIQLETWLVEETKGLGGTIDRAAAVQLVALVGNATWQLSQELQKLVAYAGGKEITTEMVTLLVHATFEEKIFDFIDAVSRRDAKKAVSLLQNERLAGTADMQMLSMLGRQVRILVQTRSFLDRTPGASKDQVASALGVHPYVVQKAMTQAKAFSLPKLLVLHDLLFELDQKTKRGMDAGFAVEQVMTRMVTF